jgi:phenylpropionate dioxygenase-like ring-hydroxylating dioxygenase large terminal subunit
MFSNIQPKYYFNKNVFNLEKNIIFSENWIFVGFKQDLSNNNDFIAKKIGDVPIVIQNFNGELKAFMNVCSHRFSILQTESKGNRSLFCPYHGWSYNKEGMPTGIPKKPLFKDFSKKELCDLKLKEYTLDTCGDMVFVHIEKPKYTLKQYLGNFYNEIKTLSENKGDLIDTNTIDIKSNWKIIVENTLESYHVNLVHSDTFRKLGAKGLDFEFDNEHSSWDAELNLSENDPTLHKIHSHFSERDFKIDGYKHYIIYPNLLISTSYGISYNFSVIEPISPNQTNFTSYVYLTPPSKENVVTETYKDLLIDFNRKVFDEDKAICEEVQKGVEVTDKPGVLSLEEKRVHHFQKSYLDNFYALL